MGGVAFDGTVPARCWGQLKRAAARLEDCLTTVVTRGRIKRGGRARPPEAGVSLEGAVSR